MFCYFKERDQYQLSTLSHVINARAQGYQELPEWPEVAPDPSVRTVEVPKPVVTASTKPTAKKFYSSSEGTVFMFPVCLQSWLFFYVVYMYFYRFFADDRRAGFSRIVR